MNKKITKAIAGTLIASTITTSTTVKSEAYDAAVVEEIVNATAGTPIAPFVIGGALIITGVTAVIGIKHKEESLVVYRSLEYLPGTWKPNSIVERVKPNGKVIQRRWYGADGKPEFDVDLTDHGAPKYHPFTHGGAHKHTFDYTKEKARQPGVELTDEEYDKYVKNFDSNTAERIDVKSLGGK